MKTKEVLDKYTKLINGLLGPGTVKFEVVDKTGPSYPQVWKEVGELISDKNVPLDWCLGDYRLRFGEEIAARWTLYQLPHCCAIAVSCAAYVHEKFRNKRLGSLLNSLRQEIVRLLGYSLLMCTDITRNTHQRQLLKTQGWKDIYQVHNKRTKNDVIISVINV